MSVKNIVLKRRQEKTSMINWKEKFLEIREDYKMLWQDYKGLVCRIGKLPNAAHIREQLNKSPQK